MNDFLKMYSFKIHLICSYSMNYWNCNIHENSIGIIGDFDTNWKRQEILEYFMMTFIRCIEYIL